MISKNKIKIAVIIFSIVTLVLFGYVIFSKCYLIKQPIDKNSTEKINYTIESGSTPQTIADDLEEKNVIKNSDYMLKLFEDKQAIVYANTYSISPSMTPEDIFNIITSSTSNIDTENSLLIYEGETLEEIALAVNKIFPEQTEKDIMDYWDNETNLKKWIDKYDILDESVLDKDIRHPLEGYFYPATYPVSEDDTIEDLTESILDNSEKMYGKYIDQENPSNLSFHDALTLASIIERETMTDTDKYKVASVFENRLKKGMPLQSDITVLYAMDEHKEEVTYEDLEYDSPYNTYQVNKLPPGPIASPVITSLDAVYNPSETDYLYFFAKQDTGEILYSSTLEEHEEISKKYAWK